MKIELTNEEARALVGLIDAAVKATGIQAAETAMHFVRKIDIASKMAEEPPKSEE